MQYVSANVRLAGSGRGLPLRQLARRLRDLTLVHQQKKKDGRCRSLGNAKALQLRRRKAGPTDYLCNKKKR